VDLVDLIAEIRRRELARHLEVSVSTGTYCAYRPEHPVVWEL
jgi:hypothetical protein